MTRRPLFVLAAFLLLAVAVVGLVAQGKPASSGKPAAHAGPAMIVWNQDQGAWSDIPGASGAQMKTIHAEPGKAPTDLMI